MALAVREWFNMSRPISLVYIWGHYFLYLVDYLSYATYITIPSILLVMVILSRASCYAPPLFLLVLLFQSFYHLVLKWCPLYVPVIYLFLVYLLGRSDFVKFVKGFPWSFILGIFLLVVMVIVLLGLCYSCFWYAFL